MIDRLGVRLGVVGLGALFNKVCVGGGGGGGGGVR